MLETDEHLRLPHGHFDRDAVWAAKERKILNEHAASGNLICCSVKKYAPLGFSSTFARGANTAGDKTYRFDDKGGRSLTLSCDSTPSIFRHYLTSSINGAASRVAFVAPLFRYWRNLTRHFTQIGYTLINEQDCDGPVDVPLVQLASAVANLCKRVKVDIDFHLNTYHLLRGRLLRGGVNAEMMPSFLQQLQFAKPAIRADLLNEQVSDEKIRHELLRDLTSAPSRLVDPRGMPLPDAKNSFVDEAVIEMARALGKHAGVGVIYDPSNLHSIETSDGYAIRFVTKQGSHLGDGGKYHDYAQRFDPRIKTCYSVATGVEALERNGQLEIEQDAMPRMIVFVVDASPLFVFDVVKGLQQEGNAVCVQPLQNKNLGKSFKKAAASFSHAVVLGQSEEQSREFHVKLLSTRGERKARITSQNTINYI